MSFRFVYSIFHTEDFYHVSVSICVGVLYTCYQSALTHCSPLRHSDGYCALVTGFSSTCSHWKQKDNYHHIWRHVAKSITEQEIFIVVNKPGTCIVTLISKEIVNFVNFVILYTCYGGHNVLCCSCDEWVYVSTHHYSVLPLKVLLQPGTFPTHSHTWSHANGISCPVQAHSQTLLTSSLPTFFSEPYNRWFSHIFHRIQTFVCELPT